jgi:thymidylate synthase (FAD)
VTNPSGPENAGTRQYTAEQIREIDDARAAAASTRRPTSEALEAIMFTPIDVLDHGFIRVVDYMGDDGAVVQGARVSYGKGTAKTSSDRDLIRYLLRRRHSTPFELAELKIHVSAPLFVTRQWFRHRTASINEYSARYSVLEREFYMPALDMVAAQSSSNKQGRGEMLDGENASRVLEILRDDASRAYDNYLWMLNETETGETTDPNRPGLARELARINLPVGIYTQFYWKVNLWNLLHFLSLRVDPHAQYEIRVFAQAILDVVQQWVPIVHEAFGDYMLNSVTLSHQSIALVQSALASDKKLNPRDFGLKGRELRELLEQIPELAHHVEQK